MHMNVLYQFNEKYAPYAGVSITSLFENNKNADEICVYILVGTNDFKCPVCRSSVNDNILYLWIILLYNRLDRLFNGCFFITADGYNGY